MNKTNILKVKTQLITGKTCLSRDRFVEIKNNHIKPIGGLWSSTYTPNEEYHSSWAEWCYFEQFFKHQLNRGVIFEFKKTARIFTVDSYIDLCNLKTLAGKYDPTGGMLHFSVGLNYEEAKNHFDVIHLTERGQMETRFSMPDSLYGWDCECCLILDYDCIDEQTIKPYYNFQVGEHVFIESNQDLIQGIHNHETDTSLIHVFGEIIPYSRYFRNTLKGEILKKGKYNMFVIKAGDKNYIYSNKYNEMTIVRWQLHRKRAV